MTSILVCNRGRVWCRRATDALYTTINSIDNPRKNFLRRNK